LAAVFLNSGIQGQGCLGVVGFGGGTNRREASSRVLREIHRVFGFQRRPEGFGFGDNPSSLAAS